MERRHDRPPVVGLDQAGLRVHGDVERPVAGSEDREREAEKPDRRAQHGQQERQAERDRRDGRHGTAPEPPDHPAGRGEREYRPCGHGEEDDPELAVAQPVPRLDCGHVRHPAREHDAVHEEDRGDGEPGAGRRPMRHEPTSSRSSSVRSACRARWSRILTVFGVVPRRSADSCVSSSSMSRRRRTVR